MTPSDQIVRDWAYGGDLPWGLTLTMVAFAGVYWRGWRAIRRTRPEQFPQWRLWCYQGGLAVLWASIASPLDGFADVLLSAHMVQHLLLMSVVPPLIWLGFPVVPLLRGLPRWLVRGVVGPVIRTRWVRRVEGFVTLPVTAWLLFNVTFLLWHVPGAYDFALENERVHDFEHICFLATSLLFWWPVLEPWPSKAASMRWGALVYLMTADLINTALSAVLAFGGRPLYSYYQTQPNPFDVSLLDDQMLGAAIMWVFGSFAFLIPTVVLTAQMLRPKRRIATETA